jgi:hypothetical protein
MQGQTFYIIFVIRTVQRISIEQQNKMFDLNATQLYNILTNFQLHFIAMFSSPNYVMCYIVLTNKQTVSLTQFGNYWIFHGNFFSGTDFAIPAAVNC